MLYLLREAGYEILPSVEGADLVIVNTCGFIDSAKSEAIDNILAMGAPFPARCAARRRSTSSVVPV